MNGNRVRAFTRAIATCALTAVLLVCSYTAHAGYVAVGATIVRVTNTGENGSTFAIKVTGGSGPCVGEVWIGFPVTSAPEADTHKRAYAAALMALAMGLRVTIYNYSSDSCDGASYIEIYH